MVGKLVERKKEPCPSEALASESKKNKKNKDKTNLVTRVADDETFVSDSWTSICLFIFHFYFSLSLAARSDILLLGFLDRSFSIMVFYSQRISSSKNHRKRPVL